METGLKKNKWVCQRGPENNEYSVENRHTQGFGFRSGFDERRAENKLQIDA
jgi:hypothetical protein